MTSSSKNTFEKIPKTGGLMNIFLFFFPEMTRFFSSKNNLEANALRWDPPALRGELVRQPSGHSQPYRLPPMREAE